MKRFFAIFTLLVFVSLSGLGQSNASFKGEIDQFLKMDQQKMPPKNAILFIGSSSFRKWIDVDEYFPGYTIINRGFGGSQLPNLIYYADKIIYPYHPRQIIVYCGENDFDYDRQVSVDTVFERFHTLFDLIRTHLPEANIGFVSIKLSPSRKFAWDKIKQTNSLIKDFLEEQYNAQYIDINRVMFDENGQPIMKLYLEDHLHMTPAGYALWQKQIQPYLLKD